MNVSQQVKNLFRVLANAFTDESFLKAIRRIENIVSKVMAITLVVVIFGALFDLLRILTIDLFLSDP